jgi:hypothetical protein
MKAITIKQPLLIAMTHGTNRTYNLRRAPARALIGQRIALHSAATMEKYTQWVAESHRLYVENADWVVSTLGCVVATATLAGWVGCYYNARQTFSYDVSLAPKSYRPLKDEWLTHQQGNVGWILEDVELLAVAVPAKGRMYLWDWEADPWEWKQPA